MEKVQIMLFCLLLLAPSELAVREHHTLTSLEASASLKPCARGCIAYGSNTGCWVNAIASLEGCDWTCDPATGGVKDECYCRKDLMPAINLHLSNCIKAASTMGDYRVDLAPALTLFNDYCAGSFTIAPLTTTTASTTTSSAIPTTTSSTAVSTTAATTVPRAP
ncbi:hypothetical protein B0H63DRAFT_522985 [Podospora didyma]|uniref:Extracellular membrane protein CFEM domain-containing protein n=1 Tax=Podospora didyma TaxID=330526 RepID=A0AAE0TZS2_9PEZI|nr:hypothetical protein B0H63DRAFT_522985 [Podospora didyma]